MRVFARKRDLLLIAALLFISFMILLIKNFPYSGDDFRVAIVEKDGNAVYRVELDDLEEQKVLTIDGEIPVTVLLDAEGACISYSACPDQLCVKAGKLTTSGQCAVCLPARVSLRIEGEKQTADGITG